MPVICNWHVIIGKNFLEFVQLLLFGKSLLIVEITMQYLSICVSVCQSMLFIMTKLCKHGKVHFAIVISTNSGLKCPCSLLIYLNFVSRLYWWSYPVGCLCFTICQVGSGYSVHSIQKTNVN